MLSCYLDLLSQYQPFTGSETDSWQKRAEFDRFDLQVHIVNYADQESLRYALQGVDLVISTISGREQLNLINAAGQNRVRLVIPSEFEGKLSHRPRRDPLDHGSAQALALLDRWAAESSMRYTIFSCGIFMERFLPQGLGSLNMGVGTGVSMTGDYILNINDGTADYVDKNSKGELVRICMTSVNDLAKFIVAAVEMGPGTWPKEFTLRGDRLYLRQIVSACSQYRQGKLSRLHYSGHIS